MSEQEVLDFAVINGYMAVEKLPDWQGYEVYEPILSANNLSYSGAPYVILVNADAGEIRMSTEQEAYDNLEHIIGLEVG